MQLYDLIMIAVLVGAAFLGAWQGFAWQVASFSSIVVSFFMSHQLRHSVARFFNEEPTLWDRILAMLIVYLVISLAIWVVFRFIAQILDRLKLKEFDRHTGAVVGFAKGVMLCVVITLFAVTLLGEQTRESIVKSLSGYYIAVLIDRAGPLMPDEVREVVAPYVQNFETQLAEDERNRDEQGGESGAGVVASVPDASAASDSDASPGDDSPIWPLAGISAGPPSSGWGGGDTTPPTTIGADPPADLHDTNKPADITNTGHEQPGGQLPSPPDYSIPSDDAVLAALRRTDPPAAAGQQIVRSKVRIQKRERVGETVGLPRIYPMVGTARMRTAQFRCTVVSDKEIRGAGSNTFAHTFRNLVETVDMQHEYLEVLSQ
jgi:membrane protein required for colicin V production